MTWRSEISHPSTGRNGEYNYRKFSADLPWDLLWDLPWDLLDLPWDLPWKVVRKLGQMIGDIVGFMGCITVTSLRLNIGDLPPRRGTYL